MSSDNNNYGIGYSGVGTLANSILGPSAAAMQQGANQGLHNALGQAGSTLTMTNAANINWNTNTAGSSGINVDAFGGVSKTLPPHQTVGVSTSAFDMQQIQCPQCHTNNKTDKKGIVNINGFEHDYNHCSNCNHLFISNNGSQNALVAEIRKIVPNADVSFHDNTQIMHTSSPTINPILDTYNLELKISEQKQELTNLRYTLQDMVNELRVIVNQNNKLQDKLANDPLIKIRESIDKFNLE